MRIPALRAQRHAIASCIAPLHNDAHDLGNRPRNNLMTEEAMHGVFLDRDTLDHGDIDFTSLAATLADWAFHDLIDEAEVVERIALVTAGVSNKVMLSAAALQRAPALKLGCISATGTNNVDLDAARRLGITVCNVRSYATPSVAEHVFALILALTRRLPDYVAAVAAGRWQR